MSEGGRTQAAVLGDQEFALLNDLLETEYGLSFPLHKREILVTRLAPRLAALGLRHFSDYVTLLQFDGRAERAALCRAVTNNETYFFRETGPMRALFGGDALEGAKARASVPGQLSLLCAGCSSGEEAYTVSIIAREHQFRLWGWTVAVDGFDLDDSRIAIARSAVYGPSSFRGVAADEIGRYFTAPQEGGEARAVKPMYRQNVRFSVANLVDVASYRRATPYDVIFCRNVLIYFAEPALRRAVSALAECLVPGGLLFLGHSESIMGLDTAFEPIRLGDSIAYRKARG